jgi:hypothetical protein
MALDTVEALKTLTKRMELLRSQVSLPVLLQTDNVVYSLAKHALPLCQHTEFANNLLKERDAAYNSKAKVSAGFVRDGNLAQKTYETILIQLLRRKQNTMTLVKL